MHTKLLATSLLVSLLAACGGKSFDSDPNQGGSDPGGTDQGGSGPKGGSAPGGSTGKAGAPQGGTGQGGGGSVCDTFDDQPGGFIAVEIHNQTGVAIHLGPQEQTCGTEPLFTIQDGNGDGLAQPGFCSQSCQTFRRQGPSGCPSICLSPETLKLAPGEVYLTGWDARYLQGVDLPRECQGLPEYGSSCQQLRQIQPGTFTFASHAGLSADCSGSPDGSCQCMPSGNGGCITPNSVSTGQQLTATTKVVLDASYGVYGSYPPPVPAQNPPGDAAPPGGAVAYQAIQIIFTK